MRFYIRNILEVAAGDDEQENQLWRAVRELADEMNSRFGDYQVTLEHLDTDDYLTFTRIESDAERLAGGHPVPCVLCGNMIQPGDGYDTTMEGAVICNDCGRETTN